ncbi:MAG: alpha/beta hydrolase family protein [Bacteroidetes bacterium]|nr:alpha/beta hydrolase family protein [Bacteroidota bacterium]
MRKTLILLCCMVWVLSVKGAVVDTVDIYSNAMQKSYKCVVIKPAAYKHKKERFPVIYLLHGYSGWYSNWLLKVPALKDLADEHRMMIVCPDGGYSSWYLNSPVDTAWKFETYIAEEVISFIDARYRTIPDRTGRAITGLSMGGHGGLYLGFRHAGIFGACGSMSGGVYLRPFPKNWDLAKRLGDTLNHAANWESYSVINIIEKKPADSLAIIVDCGTEDFFYNVNHALHEKMLRLHIPHDYIERPGRHDWAYWSNAVEYQALFFSTYFGKNKK